MAESNESGKISWYAPDPRAILPLESFHCPKSLLRVVRQGSFTVRFDSAFTEVMRACSVPRVESPGTWISDELIERYTELHRMGYAHSVECWQDGTLAGGLYGVSIGGAFMGESMFHRVRDASKVALYHLVERLRAGNFTLLDVQFRTSHLSRFGVVEISRDEYEARLAEALEVDASFA